MLLQLSDALVDLLDSTAEEGWEYCHDIVLDLILDVVRL
jgi:hypothetical protein